MEMMMMNNHGKVIGEDLQSTGRDKENNGALVNHRLAPKGVVSGTDDIKYINNVEAPRKWGYHTKAAFGYESLHSEGQHNSSDRAYLACLQDV